MAGIPLIDDEAEKEVLRRIRNLELEVAHLQQFCQELAKKAHVDIPMEHVERETRCYTGADPEEQKDGP